ncbi:MAG: peptidoglycan DD-metalloendopeptidase family protein [Bifidobacteriaceae bacterium]|nr:peptidoglycan DD-metalloendopeptidase family protein [Bifidobacteriaceae bacterium]
MNWPNRLGRLAAAALAAAGLALAGAAAPSGAAKDKDQLEQERADNQRALEQLAVELEDTDAALRDTYLELEAAKAELPLAQAELEAAQADYAAALKAHDELVEALKRAQEQKAEVTAQLEQDVELARASELSLGALARDAMMGYAAGDSDLMVLLGASSIEQAARDLVAAEAAARTRQSVIVQAQQSAGANKNRKARLETVTAEIADLEAQAQAALDAADAAQQAAEQAKRELDQLLAAMEELAGELARQKAAAEARQADLEADNKQIQAELDAILEQERQANNIPPATGGTPPPPSAGFFGRPLASLRVASPFGWRVHPIYGTMRHHDGVDLSAGCGTPIYASAGGKVVFTGWAGGYGNRVVVSHGNVNGALMFSTYNHIVDGGILVANGAQVSQGQQIANVGTTGASTGCHLHFEIGIGSASGVVNPMNYIS